jgi:hypothetical protein
MALRPALALAALALLCSACGAQEAAPPSATAHLAENEIAYRNGGRPGNELSLAWSKALRTATSSELTAFAPGTADAEVRDWFLVQTCSFGGNGGGYWVNPVAHRVLGATSAAPADLPVGGCDPGAGAPAVAQSTGDACMDAWNEWIRRATVPYRSAAARAREAYVGRLDGRCLVVLEANGEGVILTQGDGTDWTFLDADHDPPSSNALVRADGTLGPD